MFSNRNELLFCGNFKIDQEVPNLHNINPSLAFLSLWLHTLILQWWVGYAVRKVFQKILLISEFLFGGSFSPYHFFVGGVSFKTLRWNDLDRTVENILKSNLCVSLVLWGFICCVTDCWAFNFICVDITVGIWFELELVVIAICKYLELGRSTLSFSFHVANNQS